MVAELQKKGLLVKDFSLCTKNSFTRKRKMILCFRRRWQIREIPNRHPEPLEPFKHCTRTEAGHFVSTIDTGQSLEKLE